MKKIGLTKREAEKKLKKYGFNEIEDISKATALKILLRQIKSNFMVYLLFVAAIISLSVGKTTTAYAIFGVIVMVITIGFIQEYRAEKAIESLKEMLVAVSIVIRDGKEREIQSSQIVPGDILVLRNGEKIPADCLLLEEWELRVNEAILTGESKEVRKKIKKKKKYTDENLIFMGTYIVNGHCVAKVIHTGMNTRFGKIAKLISGTEKEMPLQNKVNKIVRYMVILAITISVLTGAVMLWRSTAIDEEVIFNVLILVIALSVSAFPEGMPVVMIATLASGAYKMAKQNAIVNRMSAIETLGETTVICSDKTGTITKGEMTVKKIFAGNFFYEITGTGYVGKGDFLRGGKKIKTEKDIVLKLLMNNCVLCNDSVIERTGTDMEYKTNGSPTESALLILGAKAGVFKEDIQFQRMEEIPFNSDRKMMSVLCKINGEKIVYSKGAPEYILKKCKFIQKENGIFALKPNERRKLLETNGKMTTGALRTMAFAYKKVSKLKKDNFEEDLVFIGLVGMEDPAREEVKEAIKQCEVAGIKVKMITGDNKETAGAIAKEVGLHGKLIEGYELDNLTDDELAKMVDSIAIFSRVKPEHKLRIVNALKANGELVTMTGDGVNDAPALKEAHIGIAMGKKGTDVSRSVADITLKDDNFKTIVSAIGEGRTIFKNIRKFSTYQLSCNFAELLILFIGVLCAPLLGWQIPILVAIQILFMNLVTDNLPAITLGLNPSSRESMLEKPRKNSQILNVNLIILLISTGIIMTILTLSSFFLVFNIIGETTEHARTTALFTLISLEIVSAYNFRSFKRGVLNRHLMANPYLFYASAISLIATFAIIYVPQLNGIFETIPIGIYDIGVAVVLSLLLAVIFDIFKHLNKKLKILNLEHV